MRVIAMRGCIIGEFSRSFTRPMGPVVEKGRFCPIKRIWELVALCYTTEHSRKETWEYAEGKDYIKEECYIGGKTCF